MRQFFSWRIVSALANPAVVSYLELNYLNSVTLCFLLQKNLKLTKQSRDIEIVHRHNYADSLVTNLSLPPGFLLTLPLSFALFSKSPVCGLELLVVSLLSWAHCLANSLLQSTLPFLPFCSLVSGLSQRVLPPAVASFSGAHSLKDV